MGGEVCEGVCVGNWELGGWGMGVLGERWME